MKKTLLLVVCLCLSTFTFAQDTMDQARMIEIVKSMTKESSGEGGFVELEFQGMTLYLISDAKNDRMRIITPIAKYADIPEAQKDILMQANFHSSLDARYAVSKGILYSAFIHPLSYLSEHEIKSAVIQVYNLSASFGSEYTSNTLTYGAEKKDVI